MQIIRLSDPTRPDSAQVGGKGASLLQLTQLGMPVPGGMIITTPAYEAQVIRCNLRERIAPLIEQQAWPEVEKTALEIFTSCALDQELTAGLLHHYRQMKSPAVAVRSSATCEDQPGASFAGQYESYLNVHEEEDLILAIRKCWASLWNRRALFYRNRRAVDHFAARMAVVIQEMIPADAAGVLFTVDPVLHDDRNIRIEAVPGLGEALVSGSVAGEVYRIDRGSLNSNSGGGAPGLLEPRSLADLCVMALRVEEHFGSPQDIEFAVFNGEVHLLQARPMTSLRQAPVEPLQPPGKPSLVDRMIKPFVDERYAVAPRPLDNIVFTRLLGGHIYAVRECGGVIRQEDEAAFQAQIWRQAYRLPPIHRLWLALFYGMYHQFRQLGTDWQSWWESGPRDAICAVAETVNVSTMEDEELFARADGILAVWEGPLYQRLSAAGGIHAESWLKLLVSLAVGFKKSREVMSNLMTGLKNPTIDLNEELWQLSRLARRNPAVRAAVREMAPDRLRATVEGREFLQAFGAFLQKYGHREGSCWYLTTPTWRQDPMQVWGLLSSMVEAERRAGSPEQVRMRRLASLALVEKRLRFIPGLLGAFHWLLTHLSQLNAFRESSHFDLTRPLAALQEVAAEWGRRLFERGVLEREDDVGYLTYEEVREWLCGTPPPADDVRKLVAGRRATYRVVNAGWQAERFGGAGRSGELRGIAASPGVIGGKARIIRGEHEFGRFLAGEVLVSPYTNPAWTPLFATAAAVITETGGVSSHAAIAAREYGVPAVMGVSRVTRILKDGQQILVDGNRGVVSG